MISISGSLWPYVVVTLCWIAVCGYFLHRAWKSGGSTFPRNNATPSRARKRTPGAARDTQAGRI